MKNRIFLILLSTVLVALLFIYFSLNPSYQKSLDARVYYYLEDYKKAHDLALEAIALDRYNKMAITVKNQSAISLKYESFIDDAKGYLDKIEIIAKKDVIDRKDRIKIKVIAEIVMGRYKRLSPTSLTIFR